MPWIRTIHQQVATSHMSKIRLTSPKTSNTILHKPGNKPLVMDWDNTPTAHNKPHVIRLD